MQQKLMNSIAGQAAIDLWEAEWTVDNNTNLDWAFTPNVRCTIKGINAEISMSRYRIPPGNSKNSSLGFFLLLPDQLSSLFWSRYAKALGHDHNFTEEERTYTFAVFKRKYLDISKKSIMQYVGFHNLRIGDTIFPNKGITLQVVCIDESTENGSPVYLCRHSMAAEFPQFINCGWVAVSSTSIVSDGRELVPLIRKYRNELGIFAPVEVQDVGYGTMEARNVLAVDKNTSEFIARLVSMSALNKPDRVQTRIINQYGTLRYNGVCLIVGNIFSLLTCNVYENNGYSVKVQIKASTPQGSEDSEMLALSVKAEAKYTDPYNYSNATDILYSANTEVIIGQVPALAQLKKGDIEIVTNRDEGDPFITWIIDTKNPSEKDKAILDFIQEHSLKAYKSMLEHKSA